MQFQTDRLTFFFKERLRGFQAKRSRKLCVISDLRMDIEREMRAVERDIIFEGDPQLPAQRASNRPQSGQNKP